MAKMKLNVRYTLVSQEQIADRIAQVRADITLNGKKIGSTLIDVMSDGRCFSSAQDQEEKTP